MSEPAIMAEDTKICCNHCDRDIVDSVGTESKIKCSVCQKTYHQSCSNVKATVLKYLLANDCFWSCDKCPKTNEVFLKLMSRVESLEKEVKEIKDSLKSLGGKKRTFSEVVNSDFSTPTGPNVKNKKLGNRLASPVKTPLLVVSLKESENCDETQKKIENSLHPSVDPVKFIRKTNRGKILVECNDRNDIETVKKKLAETLGDKCEIHEPKSVKPMIKIVGVDELKDDSELIEFIKDRNENIITNESELEVIQYKKGPKSATAILSVDYKTFERVMKVNKLTVKWKRCPVYEHLNVIRCFKCNMYGHVANDCTSKDNKCPKCAGPHKVDMCMSDVLKCSNCVLDKLPQTDHAVWSYDCPVLQRRLVIARNRTRYTK